MLRTDKGMMQTAQEKQLRYQIQCPGLPLAVYREVVAHLRQVEGVETGLIPQQSQRFDYNDSQVGSLWIQYPEGFDLAGRERVDRILAYYGDRYGSWESLVIASSFDDSAIEIAFDI